MFDKVYCVNLERRTDRWHQFIDSIPHGWPFPPPVRVAAIDGSHVPPPSWWHGGPGAWGCYRSHLRIIEDALNSGKDETILILEDDVIFDGNFTERWDVEAKRLPPDWQMLYLGGQHIKRRLGAPSPVNDTFLQAFNVNRTHAYALRGRDALKKVYAHLTRDDWQRPFHIDHHYGRLHMQKSLKVYCPHTWYCGQRAGKSNINGRESKEDRMWTLKDEKILPVKPLVLIVGLHRSGSSCIAGVAHHLGVHMGFKFAGCEADGGYEASAIAALCEQAMPFPGTAVMMDSDEFRSKFFGWVSQNSVLTPKRLVGAKYPHLCYFANWLREELPANVRVINCERPLEESIKSLVLRDGHRVPPEKLASLQEFLYEEKTKFLSGIDHLTIDYSTLLVDTRRSVEQMADYLSTPVTEAAISYVDPGKRRIN